MSGKKYNLTNFFLKKFKFDVKTSKTKTSIFGKKYIYLKKFKFNEKTLNLAKKYFF